MCRQASSGALLLWLLWCKARTGKSTTPASEDEEIIRTPQRYLEGIETDDLKGAIAITDESEWDFLARLVPSVFTDFPTLCNLIYIDFAIYIAPMKCLVGVDTKIVGIRHLNFLLYVEVAIMPDTEVSPNYFDDVAFLIAKATSEWYNDTKYNRTHANITNVPRTDENYAWISKLEGRSSYQLIGFVDVGLNLAKRYRHFTRLYKAANVTFSLEQCYRALHTELGDTKPHERAPCVLLCPLSKSVCEPRYIYSLGAVLLDQSRSVLGISTWQDNTDIRYMTPKATHPPIGIAIPNKSYFDRNFKCAAKIRDHHWFSKGTEPLQLFRDYALYDKLCNEKNSFKRSGGPIIV